MSVRWCEERRNQDKGEESTRMSLDMVVRIILLVRLLGIHRNKENRGLEARLPKDLNL